MDRTRIGRIARDYLLDFQRAGCTDWTRPQPAGAFEEDQRSATEGGTRTSAPHLQTSADAASADSDHVTSTETSPVSSKPKPAESPPKRRAIRSKRSDKLKLLSEQVSSCRRCAELASTRTQTVFGVGDPEARILFIGEAPGADEDRQGEPFVGRAGQLLNKIIAACNMERGDIYICNVLKCRPPQNRTPLPEEAENCREYLTAQIEIVDPDYIVCWGSVAARNLLDTKSPLGRLRGRFHDYGHAKVLCTYHPSYLLRYPAVKKDVWTDMKLLLADMGVDVDSL